MTDYTTQITACRDKIYQLKQELKHDSALVTAEDYFQQSCVYDLLTYEYKELAGIYRGMEQQQKGKKV